MFWNMAQHGKHGRTCVPEHGGTWRNMAKHVLWNKVDEVFRNIVEHGTNIAKHVFWNREQNGGTCVLEHCFNGLGVRLCLRL